MSYRCLCVASFQPTRLGTICPVPTCRPSLNAIANPKPYLKKNVKNNGKSTSIESKTRNLKQQTIDSLRDLSKGVTNKRENNYPLKANSENKQEKKAAVEISAVRTSRINQDKFRTNTNDPKAAKNGKQSETTKVNPIRRFSASDNPPVPPKVARKSTCNSLENRNVKPLQEKSTKFISKENVQGSDVAKKTPIHVECRYKETADKSCQTTMTFGNLEDLSKLQMYLTECGGSIDKYASKELTECEIERENSYEDHFNNDLNESHCSYTSASACLLDDRTFYFTSSVLNDTVRAYVVNWLVKLDVHVIGSAVALQSGVMYLDRLGRSAGRCLPAPAQLCGAACYWIATKLQSARVPGAACLARLSQGAFTATELIQCERLVLAKLNFPITPTVPADEVEAAWANGKVTAMEREVAHYLCCCALLHGRLSAAEPRALAAAALQLAAKLLQDYINHITNTSNIRENTKSIETAPYSEAFSPMIMAKDDGYQAWLMRSLERIAREISKPTCTCREPYLLYSTGRYKGAALKTAAALKICVPTLPQPKKLSFATTLDENNHSPFASQHVK